MTIIPALRNTTSVLLRPLPLARLDLAWINLRTASRIAAENPRNYDIQYPVVQTIDPETGRLNPPIALKDILSTLDRKKYFVELVSENPAPIVKVVDSREVYHKSKEREARVKAGRQPEKKEIQLTWGVASEDLAHKLKKVRAELERGIRVDLIYAPKKGQPFPTEEEIHLRVQETVNMMADIGKEWKPREIKKSAVAIYLQGKPK